MAQRFACFPFTSLYNLNIWRMSLFILSVVQCPMVSFDTLHAGITFSIVQGIVLLRIYCVVSRISLSQLLFTMCSSLTGAAGTRPGIFCALWSFVQGFSHVHIRLLTTTLPFSEHFVASSFFPAFKSRLFSTRLHLLVLVLCL